MAEEKKKSKCSWTVIIAIIVILIVGTYAVAVGIYRHSHKLYDDEPTQISQEDYDFDVMTTTLADDTTMLSTDMDMLNDEDQIPCGVYGNGSNISGGFNTQLEEFPWLALLEYKFKNESTAFLCSGVLIDNRHVLTNAHCLESNEIRQLINVRLGEYDLNLEEDCVRDGNQSVECAPLPVNIGVKTVKLYKNNYEMGILTLTENVTFSNFIRPICLPTAKSYRDDLFYISGWRNASTTYRTDIKQKTKVKLIDHTLCNNLYNRYLKTKVPEPQYTCAGDIQTNRTRICHLGSGFDGNPLMKFDRTKKRWEIEGILAHDSCEEGVKLPVLYIRVYPFINWIMSYITA